MPGLVPGIHVLSSSASEKTDVDGRGKPGHDVKSLLLSLTPVRKFDGHANNVGARPASERAQKFSWPK
jgi:hypothetical protein